jgi:putative hydrolase of the HAD superfamily
MNKHIEAVIFDLGGVIYDIDYQRTIDAFIQLGADPQAVMYSQAAQSGMFDAYETGQITSEDFLTSLQQEMPDGISTAQIKSAWNAILIGQPVHRLTFLRQLGKQLPIYLLSNTNALHIEQIYKELDEQFGLSGYHELFEATFLSYEIGLRKPDVETFQTVIQRTGVDPAKTLFIDDSPQHLVGAKQAGLQTYHHVKGDIVDVWQFNSTT